MSADSTGSSTDWKFGVGRVTCSFVWSLTKSQVRGNWQARREAELRKLGVAPDDHGRIYTMILVGRDEAEGP